MTKKALLVAAALTIAVASFVPFPTTVAQPLKVQFTTTDNQPVAGIRVYQNWGFDGLPDHGNYEAFSDASGSVIIPAHKAHGSSIRRFLRRAITLVFVHSSYGNYVSISLSLPPALEAKFRSPEFSPRKVSGVTDGYYDIEGREYHPSVRDHPQFILVLGDFAAGSDTLRFVLEKKTPNQNPEAK